ncbi:MAG: ATP-binding cassette domain-containing protein, partial [Thermomicrobiales bacterium]
TERKDNPDGDDAPPVLRLIDVSAVSPDDGRNLKDINIDLLPGQILVIVGIDGQGQSQLAGVIAGYQRSEGQIELAGHVIRDVPAVERARLGVALLVDDRLGEAAIGSFSIAENLVLKRPRREALTRRGVFRRDRVLSHAQSVIARWGIEPSDPHARFGSLSGGNMQRVLAGRELDRVPQVLIALNPVQGLDVRTANLLWEHMRGIADRGSAVLVFSTDLDEAFARADRCGVIHDGRVSPLLPVHQAAKRAYGSMMVNGW